MLALHLSNQRHFPLAEGYLFVMTMKQFMALLGPIFSCFRVTVTSGGVATAYWVRELASQSQLLPFHWQAHHISRELTGDVRLSAVI